MLSRTADSLFWFSRYVERADYLARVLEAATRLSSLPIRREDAESEWASALETAGCMADFTALYDRVSPAKVIRFLAYSKRNPTSIRNCLRIARRNARQVRTCLTAEMWDTINSAWLELNKLDFDSMDEADFGELHHAVDAFLWTPRAQETLWPALGADQRFACVDSWVQEFAQ